ncbi:MAG: tetratricopeptide repeat protein [Acidobacteria bacterium]|nr:tetratricopeptide repeat protein [Acidobacteriota bacterium]
MKKQLFLLLLLSGERAAGAPQIDWNEIKSLLQRGEYRQVEDRVLASEPATARGLRLLMELSERKGSRTQADEYAGRLLDLYRQGKLRTSQEIGHAACAAWRLDLWHEANEIFMEAAAATPVSVEMYVDWGNLYLEKFNAAEAESIFREALGLAPRDLSLDAAYVGLARALKDQSKPGVTETLKTALALNPENMEALAFQATLSLQEENWEETLNTIHRGLAINPNFLPLLRLKCAAHYFRDESAAFEDERRKILAINPKDADLYELLGEMAVLKRRSNEANDFYREAIRLDLRHWSAVSALGINLLRLGEEEEGKQLLEQAYNVDPFNIWTVNTLRLLDSFDRFSQLETAHFRVKLHQEEAGALRPYIEELLERSLTTLEKKYGHEVSGKYVFEMYRDHEDFAVRTLGLPGLGALGATFGRVVAMDSPSARPRDQFHWGSTLWHEVAHVVTLSLSNHRVPRWVTEGISMMEERKAGAGWGEHLNPHFVEAYRKGELLSLRELNSGFNRPRNPLQLEISYFQAGWICEFIEQRHGAAKIQAMLISFAHGKTLEQIFKEDLSQTIDEFEAEFRRELEGRLTPLVRTLDTDRLNPVLEKLSSVEELVQIARSAPESYYTNLLVGQRLHQLGKSSEAIPFIENAVRLFPWNAGEDSPYDLLVKIHEKLQDKARLIGILKQWWKVSPKLSDNAVKLARLLSEGDSVPVSALQEAAQVLEESMFVDPLDVSAHQLLADLYLQLQQPEKAARELQVLLTMKPTNPAQVHYGLARAYKQSGDVEAARRQALLALEIAPGYELAQQLLLELTQ